jgi:hypothetical protein
MPLGHLLRTALPLLAICVSPPQEAAQAQTIELKLSHFIPPNHTFHKWM